MLTMTGETYDLTFIIAYNEAIIFLKALLYLISY